MGTLTPREQDVLRVIRTAGARTTTSVARLMGISYDTADVHLSSINGKLPTEFEPTAPRMIRVVLFALYPPPASP